MSTTRLVPSVSSAAATCRRAVVSFDSPPTVEACDMLGERSRSTIAADARSPPTTASHPCDSGRLIARIAAATASIRRSMISHCRSRL